jgi:hypothetical protein
MRRSWLRWIGLLMVALGGLVLCFVPRVPAASGDGCLPPAASADYTGYRRIEDTCTHKLVFAGSGVAARRYQSLAENPLPVWVFVASGLAAVTGGVTLFVVGNRGVAARETSVGSKGFRALRWGVAGFVVLFIGSVWAGDQLYRAGYLSYESDWGPYVNAFLLVPSAIALIGAGLGFSYRPRAKAKLATAEMTAQTSTPIEHGTQVP